MLDELAVKNGIWLGRAWKGIDPLIPILQLAADEGAVLGFFLNDVGYTAFCSEGRRTAHVTGKNLEILLRDLLCTYLKEPACSRDPFPLRDRKCEQEKLAALCELPQSWSGLDEVLPLLNSIGKGLVKWDGQRSRNRPHITVVIDGIRRDGFTLEEALTEALIGFFLVKSEK